MPISTSSFGDKRDDQYSEYEQDDLYDVETIDFPGLTPGQAEDFLKRLGGGVEEKRKSLEGVGWKALITPIDGGVSVTFNAHDELLDDLIRRFEDWVEKTG